MLYSHLRLGLLSGLFPTGFPTNNLYTFLFSLIRATCPAHLILLDFIILIILGKEHNLEIKKNKSDPQYERELYSLKRQLECTLKTQRK
jgi:hypothetical protein